MNSNLKKVKKLVQFSFFVALILLLGFTPFIGYINLGFTRATIVHIPVILGSLIFGPVRGAILGFTFGFTSFINNSFLSPTVTSFVFTPFYDMGPYSGGWQSLVICFIPRILVGVLPYYVMKLVNGKNKNYKSLRSIVGFGLAGLSGALINTILVMSGIYVFFGEQYAAANGKSVEALMIFILTIVGTNGVPEAIVASLIAIVLGKVFLNPQMSIKLNFDNYFFELEEKENENFSD